MKEIKNEFFSTLNSCVVFNDCRKFSAIPLGSIIDLKTCAIYSTIQIHNQNWLRAFSRA